MIRKFKAPLSGFGSPAVWENKSGPHREGEWFFDEKAIMYYDTVTHSILLHYSNGDYFSLDK